MALPIGLAIGFGEAAYKIFQGLSGSADAAEKLSERADLAERFKQIAEQVAKIQASMRDIGQSANRLPRTRWKRRNSP